MTNPLSSPSRAARSVAARLAAVEDRLAIDPDAGQPCPACGQPPPRPSPPLPPNWRADILDAIERHWPAMPPPTDDERRRNRTELLDDADRLDRLTAGDPAALSWPSCPRCGEREDPPGTPLPTLRRHVRSILRDAARGWTEAQILAGHPEAIDAARTEARRYRAEAEAIAAQLAHRDALENPPVPGAAPC